MNRILLVLLLAGCGGSSHTANDNNGYGWSYDAAAPSGLRVRYANDKPPRIDLIDGWYLEVARCMALDPAPPGPLVILDPDLVSRTRHDSLSFGGTIVIDAYVTQVFDWSPSAPVQAPHWVFKHEMVHYLLWATGFPEDRNHAHDSPFFDSCTHS